MTYSLLPTPAASLTRRRLLLAGASAPFALGMPRLASAASQPIKIALLTSLSGPFAALGESMRAGMELFLEQNQYQMGGRPVTLLVEDDQGKPAEALRKVNKLISRDKIDVLSGVISAAVALAIRDTVADARLLTFISNAAANALAREAASSYIFRPTKTSWMLGHTGALWTHGNIATSGGMTLASDYAAGREYINDFHATFQELGGVPGQEIWTPLGTSDFAPLIMSLAAAAPKFVYAFLPGADAVRFLQQMRDYRMQDKIQLIGPGALFDQEDVLTAAGAAGLGGINTFHQSPGAPYAAAFVAAYQASRGRLPGEASTSGYATAQVIKAGIDAVNGDVANKDRLKSFLLEEAVDTAFGPMQFDHRNNQAILDIYVNQVQADDNDQPINTVIHTYKGIRDPGPSA